MKKLLYFIALFAFCCVFITWAGVSYAQIELEPYFSTPNWWVDIPDPVATCYSIAYGATASLGWVAIGSGQSACTAINFVSLTYNPWGYTSIEILVSKSPTSWTENHTTDFALSSYYASLNWSGTEWISGFLNSSALIITSPISDSTITDDTTLLTGEWANIDSTIWTNIRIAFNDLQINETSAGVDIPITANTGTFSFALSNFEIPNNGAWTLRAIVENEYEINYDVPNPTYFLIFDIAGLPTPYAFTDFETWYSENVSDYEAPSTWAVNLTGFLNPIFEKIGQFGDRINTYLDISTAYEKGNQIGAVFPVVGVYVSQIDVFFGGFPLIQFFKWGILIMFALFAVKMIFKLLAFIPFIGGGG